MRPISIRRPQSWHNQKKGRSQPRTPESSELARCSRKTPFASDGYAAAGAPNNLRSGQRKASRVQVRKSSDLEHTDEESRLSTPMARDGRAGFRQRNRIVSTAGPASRIPGLCPLSRPACVPRRSARESPDTASVQSHPRGSRSPTASPILAPNYARLIPRGNRQKKQFVTPQRF